MYTTSTTVSSRIESYCRTWRMWLENDESVIMGDNIMSATSDVQSRHRAWCSVLTVLGITDKRC